MAEKTLQEIAVERIEAARLAWEAFTAPGMARLDTEEGRRLGAAWISARADADLAVEALNAAIDAARVAAERASDPTDPRD